MNLQFSLDNSSVSPAPRFWENTGLFWKSAWIYFALFKCCQSETECSDFDYKKGAGVRSFYFFPLWIDLNVSYSCSTHKLNFARPDHCQKITFYSCHIWTCAFDLVKYLPKCMYVLVSNAIRSFQCLYSYYFFFFFLVLPVRCKFSFWYLKNIFCQIFNFYFTPSLSKHHAKDIISFSVYYEDKKSGRCDLFRSSSHPVSTLPNISAHSSRQLPVHY